MATAPATFLMEGERMAGFEAWFAKWGWVVIGLTCGFAAKYALRIKRGQRVKPVQVFADVLLLPMVGLIAYAIVGRIGVEGEVRAMFAGLCMVGADRLIAIMTDWWLRKVQAAALRDVDLELIERSGQVRETLAKVDAARSLGRSSGANCRRRAMTPAGAWRTACRRASRTETARRRATTERTGRWT